VHLRCSGRPVRHQRSTPCRPQSWPQSDSAGQDPQHGRLTWLPRIRAEHQRRRMSAAPQWASREICDRTTAPVRVYSTFPHVRGWDRVYRVRSPEPCAHETPRTVGSGALPSNISTARRRWHPDSGSVTADSRATRAGPPGVFNVPARWARRLCQLRLIHATKCHQQTSRTTVK
jgi:hypothetical protein